MFQTTWEGLGWSMFTLELQDQVRPAFLGAAVAVGAVILLLFVLKKHGWKVCAIAVYLGALCLSGFLAVDICMRGFTDLAVLLELFVSFLVVGGVEKDRLQGIQGLEQARQLRNGYSGSVRDAQSSNPNDLGRILGEIEQRGLQKEVDHAVDALLTMNIVTKELQVVIARLGGGRLGNASVWSTALFSSSCCFFVFQCVQVYRYRIYDEEPPASHWALFGVAIFEAVAWPLVFLLLPVERKAFGQRGLPLLLILFPGLIGLWPGFSFDATAHFGIIPVILVIAILGPARASRIPILGPALVRVMFGRMPCKR
ncbi:unnamed protein product [Symbiodinium natans]|uniref:Uncharacterized protein n=1 Tax=Symbiodinium natans TaxID=878477 RepID=A0A812PZY0_9DINO|nr:unnamed protein product [Symbiodinium natans]